MKKKIVELWRKLVALFRGDNDVSELDTNLPEFAPNVDNTPLCKEYLEEIEENEKCAPVCNDCTSEADFLSAMEVSATATRLGVDNTIPKELRENALLLKREIIDPLMKATGWTYRITSGFRNDRVNSAVGGSDNSHHRFARAADIVPYDANGNRVPVLVVATKIRDMGLDAREVGLYGTFTHVAKLKGNKNGMRIFYHSSYNGVRLKPL